MAVKRSGNASFGRCATPTLLNAETTTAAITTVRLVRRNMGTLHCKRQAHRSGDVDRSFQNPVALARGFRAAAQCSATGRAGKHAGAAGDDKSAGQVARSVIAFVLDEQIPAPAGQRHLSVSEWLHR